MTACVIATNCYAGRVLTMLQPAVPCLSFRGPNLVSVIYCLHCFRCSCRFGTLPPCCCLPVSITCLFTCPTNHSAVQHPRPPPPVLKLCCVYSQHTTAGSVVHLCVRMCARPTWCVLPGVWSSRCNGLVSLCLSLHLTSLSGKKCS